MVHLPLGFSLFLVSWKNLTKDDNSQNLAGVCPFLSEFWHFRFLTLSPVRLEIAVCPIFESQYIFATKVTQISVTWEAKQYPFSSFMIFRVWIVVVAMWHTARTWTKWRFGGILTAAFLQTGFQVSKENKQKFRSVWHSNYLEINFLYFLTAQTPWFLYAAKVCALGMNWKMCASVYITPHTFQIFGVLGTFQEICY